MMNKFASIGRVGKLQACAGLVVLAFSCTPKASKVKSVSLASSLTIQGLVVDQNQSPIANAQVFFAESASPLAQTGAEGTFSIALDESQINQAIAQNGDPVQKLFISTIPVSTGGPSAVVLIGLTKEIDFRLRGTSDLGPVKLGAPATIKGRVIAQDLGQNSTPVADGYIKVGRANTRTLVDGAFEISGLPAGKLIVTASAPELQSAQRQLSLQPGETLNIQEPLVLFAGNAVAGIIQPLPPGDVHELAQSGHPYQRSFRVFKSPRAQLIRYSLNESDLSASSSTPWKHVRDIMEYDFPSTGSHRLLVQLAESEGGERSEIYHVTFVVNAFGNSNGFTIEDGRGTIRRRNVSLNIDVPPNAVKMRIAESQSELAAALTLAVSPVAQFTFSKTTNNMGEVAANGFYELFLQFLDAQGAESIIYKNSVYLEVFPRANDVFKINDGAPSTPYQTVKLSINVPQSARKMRIFENAGGSSSGGSEFGSSSSSTFNILLEPASEVFYTVRGSGTRTVYLQFLDLEGAASPVYHQLIRIEPNGNAGFTIVGGGFSMTKTVRLELQAPPHVQSFKVFEDPGDSFSAPWRAIVPWTDYVFASHGAHTLYVQYRTIDGEPLDAISQTVFIEPFPTSSYGFTFAPGTMEVLPDALIGSQLLTRSQIVTVLLTPSPSAAEFSVNEHSHSDCRQAGPWRPLAAGPGGAPTATAFDFALTAFTGLKAISVCFRTAEHDVSPMLTRNIYFDPFYAPPTNVAINNGDTTTTSSAVTLNFTFGTLPTSQPLFVKSAETAFGIESAPWVPLAGNSVPWTLSPGTGLKQIFVQFKLGNVESQVFSDTIEVVP